MTASPIIHGRRFLEALENAGVIQRADRIRRVVIDADLNRAVMVYVERLGDERLIDVTIASGIEIATPKPPGE